MGCVFLALENGAISFCLWHLLAGGLCCTLHSGLVLIRQHRSLSLLPWWKGVPGWQMSFLVLFPQQAVSHSDTAGLASIPPHVTRLLSSLKLLSCGSLTFSHCRHGIFSKRTPYAPERRDVLFPKMLTP